MRPHALALASMRRLTSMLKSDVIITQNFAVRGRNSCVFLHDVLFQSNPEFFTRRELTYFRFMTASLANAHNVFTSSQTEAHRIRRHNPDLDDVIAVGLAMGRNLQEANPKPIEFAESLEGFVLTVGRLNIRKNLSAVFEAMLHSTQLSDSFPLLVVGERDGKAKDISPEVQRIIDSGHIRFLGGVSDSQLRWLYEKASALVFPSLDEGYGLPPLEAWYFGCPILLSDIPVFRELYSEKASFVDPHDPSEIAKQLDNVIQGGRRQAMRTVGSPPSWEEVVRSMRKQIANNWESE